MLIPILFTTPNCPRCKQVKKLLQELEIKYVDVTSVGGRAFAAFHDVHTLPTLLDARGRKYSKMEEIRNKVKELQDGKSTDKESTENKGDVRT